MRAVGHGAALFVGPDFSVLVLHAGRKGAEPQRGVVPARAVLIALAVPRDQVWSRLFGFQRNHAVPAIRRDPIVAGDEEREEILGFVLGRHLMEELQRSRPVAGFEGCECG